VHAGPLYAGLHLRRESLDVAIVERFVSEVVRGVHWGMRGQRLRHTQRGDGLCCGRRVARFFATMGHSLDACCLSSYGIPLPYTMRLLLSARSGGDACAARLSVSSSHDEVPRYCLRRCPNIPSWALDAGTNAPAQVTDEGVLQRTWALWHSTAAKKSGTGGKPSSVGGNALPPPAVPCPRYPRRTLTRSP
jgi:hypothetical protein